MEHSERPAGEHSQPLLALVDVHLAFGGVKAVSGTSFAVAAGRITGLIGPNGAGKSTICGIIAGALKPDSGRILLDGHDIGGRPAYQVSRAGIVRTFQLSSEFAKLTVLENLITAAPEQKGESLLGALFGRRYWGAQERRNVLRARELLDKVGLLAKQDEYAGNLSGGQKRLVEITRALMAEPRMLLLDEPMAGIHPNLARSVADYLAQLAEGGLTMLMIEHELGLVERLCDTVVVMAQGRVISEGKMSHIRLQRNVLDAYLVG
jgi:ABC-type branched-subunit amino acid transport system ATPase component